MTFSLLKSTDGETLVIARDQDVFIVGDLENLLQLRKRINSYLDTLQPDDEIEIQPPAAAADPNEYISAAVARRMAEQRGINLKPRSLRSAMERGNIPTAIKRGSRWLVPRRDFETWLATYAARQSR